MTSVKYNYTEQKHAFGEKAHTASPLVAKIPKVPPPPPLPMSAKASSPGTEVSKLYKVRTSILKASGPEFVGVLPIEAHKKLERARKSNEKILPKGYIYKKASPEKLESGKSKEALGGDVNNRSDPSRQSKESLIDHPYTLGDSIQKSKTTLGVEIDKGPCFLPKCKVSSAKPVIGPPEASNLIAEARKISRKHQETATQASAAHKNAESGSVKKTILCNECKAVSKKTVCFIANDGRVAACSSGPSEHVRCKYDWCAASDPDYVSPSAVQPRKYLVSKRHLLKAQIVPKRKNTKTPSPSSDQKGNLDNQFSSPSDECSPSGVEAVEDDRSYSEDGSQYTPKFGSGSESPEINSSDRTDFEIVGHLTESCGETVTQKRSACSGRVQTSYIDVGQENEAESIKLRRQLMQERKHAEEWMIDSAIEDAIQKLAPNGETRVKILVEAFESIIAHNDGETQELHCGGSHEHNISHTHIAMHC